MLYDHLLFVSLLFLLDWADHVMSDASTEATTAPPLQRSVSITAPLEREQAAEQKTAKKKDNNKKRRTRARAEVWSTYVHKVQQQVHPDMGMSRRSMMIMNSLLNDWFERIATEASRVMRVNKRETLTAREIQTACRLILPGELAKHAVAEGTKAITQYTASKYTASKA